MTTIQSGQLTVFHLEDIEFDDAGLKNRCLIQAQTPYIAYVLNAEVEDREFLTVIEGKGEDVYVHRKEDSPIVYVSGQTEDETVDFTGIMELVSASVVAILFPKALVRRTGAFHAGLSGKTDFEFLCRMVRETGSCRIRKAVCRTGTAAAGRDLVPKEKIAETLAYMIRYHMSYLHTLGLTDRIFSIFCEYAQAEKFFLVFQQSVNLFLSDERTYEKLARQTAPFVILRGDDTCGGVLQGFADDLADSLADSGQAVIVMDEDFTEHDMLQNMVCKGVVGFQNKALEIAFFREIHGPKFQFWFDNPLRFEGVLRNLPEEYFILCQDANYASLIRDYYHTPNAIQFPPGGRMASEQNMEQKSSQDNGQASGMQMNRPYDIVFVGNYFEDDASRLTGFEREFYDHMLLHPCETFEQGLSELRRGLDEDSFIKLSCSLKPACRAVIGHFRNAVVSTILEAGFDLHVYGDSWRNYPGAGKEHLQIHPYASVEESLKELAKAKIGLNIMSWHKAGMTERIANIMLSGAVCLTEETTYLREHMQEGEEIVTFRLDRIGELPAKIRNLLDHQDVREKIGANAYRKAKAEYTWRRRAEELIALSDRAYRDALKIFVATHVKCDPPQEPVYVPLHVGKYGKPDLGYLGDDTGENISDLNFLYGELTGLFWIWQNVYEVDYVGLCHYRRYFINSRKQAMSKQDYLELLEQYDAIVPKHAECEGSYYEHFGTSHNSRDLDAVGRALKRIYPSYGEAYDRAMEGSIYYWGNLVVTSLPILKAYAEWLFQIFVEASEEIDVSGYDDYHKRVYGFLSEQMFYVFALANGLNCCETAVGVSAEKAETKALKEQLKLLLKANRTEEARRLIHTQLQARPDLLLPGSDVTGELQAIYEQLLSVK